MVDASVSPEPISRSERRSRLTAFSLYDFADSAFATTIVSVLFNQFYTRQVIGAGVTLPRGFLLGLDFGPISLPGATVWSWLVAVSMAFVALLGPLLGALADRGQARIRGLVAFWIPGIVLTWSLSTIDTGEWLSGGLLFALAYVAFAAASIFYNALLPEVAPREEMGRASGTAWGIGYLGGALLLVINLLMLKKPQWLGRESFRVQDCFTSAALWWFVFALPLVFVFGRMERRAARRRAAAGPPAAAGLVDSARAALRQVGRTARELRRQPNLVRFFLAYLLYNDGVQTIVTMASVFGAEELGMSPASLIVLFLLIQTTALFGSIALGVVADRAGHRRAIGICVAAFAALTLWAASVGIFGNALREYWILSAIAGLFLGGIQAASRSWIAEWIPERREAELFGFFSIMTRVAAIFGPLVYGTLVLVTGSLRMGILAVTLFFLAGGILLAKVRPKEIAAEREALASAKSW